MVRESHKKGKLYLVYKVLRCAMDEDDIKMLKEKYPGFKERTISNTDNDILEGIFRISEAMTEVQTPDMNKAYPLEAS